MKLLPAAFALLASSAFSHAAVGISHIYPTGLSDFEIYQDFAKTDHTGLLFTFISGSTYRFDGTYLDEGVALYLIDGSEEKFTTSTIEAGKFELMVPDTSYTFSGETLFGLVTPAGSFNLSGHQRALGWMIVQNSGGPLIMTGHAIDYSGQGLIIGTTTVVPEPGMALLAGCGLGALAIRRRGSVA